GLGGAVLNEAGGVLTISNSSFSTNQVDAGASGLGYGGVLMNQGTAGIADSIFTDNTATGTGTQAAPQGGALANLQGHLTVSNSRFLGNQAVGATAGTSP